MSSPFVREDMETRHLAESLRIIYGTEPVVLNAYHVSLNLKRLCKSISSDQLLDFLCSQPAIVTPDWNKWPQVSISIDFYEKGPSFSPQDINFLRGECDGSYKKGVGAIAVIIWDGLDIKWCEVCMDVSAQSSIEAEAKAMYILFKRGKDLTDHMEVRSDLEFAVDVVRGDAILDPDHAQFDIFSTILFMKSHFEVVAARRVPREGLRFVDQLMRMKNGSRFTVPLPDWKPYLNGSPIFNAHSSSKASVKKPRILLQMPERICYAEAKEHQRLYALKHMVHALKKVSTLRVVAKDIDSITGPLVQLFGNASCEKLSEHTIDFLFGTSNGYKLCVVLDVGLQKVIRTDEFALTILVPLPHETHFLRSIPEFSVRSRIAFRGLPYTPPRLGVEVDIKHGLSKTLLKEGEGLEFPNDGDEIEVNYSILHDGEVLHSSSYLDGPYITKIGTCPDNIAAWNIAIKSMTRGERARFKVSHMMAYGEAGLPPNIPPKATIFMDIELVSWTALYHICEDGVIVKLVKQACTWQTPKDYDLVSVTYEASLKDGTIVSKSSGAEFILSDGLFCDAIAQSLKMMRKEEKALLVVKPEYGFGKMGRPSVGEEGAIPPNATLFIKLELLSWKTSDNKAANMLEGIE